MRRRVALAVGLLCVAFVPVSGGAPTQTPSLAALLARHVPIFVLHPSETFTPVPVDGFLADADLQRPTAAGWETIPGPLPAGAAGLRLDHRQCAARDGVSAASCYARAQTAHPSEPVVYGAAFRAGARIGLQYWVWYPYNDYSRDLPPGDVWQVHEGDWESVSVILDRTGRPLVVGLSRHCHGTRRAWAGVTKRGSRPLVYVARGSHANYFAPGVFPHSAVCWPRELRDVVRALALVDRTGSGRVVRPKLVRVTAARPSWMRFAGVWGESGYVRFPNNEPVAYQGSPRGPAFHDVWRQPVREELSWPRG